MKKAILYFKTTMSAVEEKGDTVKISGYGSTKDVDRGGDRVLPTAFTESIAESQRTSGVAMLLGHDHEKVIGSWDKIAVDTKGLPVEGTVKYDCDQCMEKIRAGDLRGLSIGYRVEAYQIEDGQGHVMYRSDTGMEAGYDYDDLYSEESVRVITKLDLVEISVVATPMNAYSFISSVKKFFAEEIKEFKQLAGKEVEVVDEPAPTEPTKVDEDGGQVVEKEDEPEPIKIEEETPAPVVPAEDPAPAEGAEKETQGSGGEDAGGNPAPVVIPEAPAPVESASVEAAEEAQKAAKAALLEEVKPLVAEMVKSAVESATATLTKQNMELNETLAGIKQVVEAQTKALQNIEAPTIVGIRTAPAGSVKNFSVSDKFILQTIGQ